VGKSRVAVANVVRLLRLPDKVKTLLAQGALTEGHARALLGLEEDGQIVQAAEQVVARGLNVRETEDLVRRLMAVAQTVHTQEDPVSDDDIDTLHTRQLEAAFRTALGTKVALSRGRRGGKLTIAFFSDEELHTLYERIVGGAL
jgi:ParB family transcriptional regulator, chromosome partitioning protein